MVKFLFVEEFGKAFVPKRFTPTLRRYFLKTGLQEPPYSIFGMLFYFGLAFAIILQLITINPLIDKLVTSSSVYAQHESILRLTLSFFSVTFVLAAYSAIAILSIYFVADLMIFKRTREMEEMFPDYLQVVSSNLKGGMTFENALWAGISPRFKVLANEMAEVAKKVMTGYQVKRALLELLNKYDSPTLRRSVDLMVSEFESGGNISSLLDNIVAHLKETRNLKEEMSASAVAYVIFISAIVVAVSPLLFALSYQLLGAISGFINNLATVTSASSALPFSFKKTEVNTEDFRLFSIISITIISLFASLIVSIVEKGDIKSGLKYIPPFVIGSLFFYLIFMKILGGLFSGFIG